MCMSIYIYVYKSEKIVRNKGRKEESIKVVEGRPERKQRLTSKRNKKSQASRQGR